MSRYKKFTQKKLVLPLVIVIDVLIIVFVGLFLVHLYQTKIATRPLQDADEFVNPPPVVPQTVIASPSASFHIPILMYHYIEVVKDTRDTIRQSLDILPTTLDKEIQTLQGAGYTFLYMSDVGKILDGKEALPPKPVVLTFDDGYGDFYTDALPVLEKNHVKATAFIISGFLGKLNYMTVEQLHAVQNSGIVEIGAHTVHHIDLQHASSAKAQKEIVESKQQLEAMLGIPVVSFAYPGGRFNPTTITLVRDAGFTTGVSTIAGTEDSVNNRFVLFRLRPGSRTGVHLLNFLDAMNRKSFTPIKTQPE